MACKRLIWMHIMSTKYKNKSWCEDLKLFDLMKNRTSVDLTLIECDAMDRVNLAQDRVQWWAVMNMVMNLQIPLNSRKLIKMSDCQLHNKKPDG
jgi:hypothetical protein